MKLTVTRRALSTFTLNLLVGLNYEDHPECAPSTFKMGRAVLTEDGIPGVHHYERELPGSLTWMPGETKVGLPAAVGSIEQFKAEQRAGRLVVIEVQEEPPTTVTPPNASSDNDTDEPEELVPETPKG